MEQRGACAATTTAVRQAATANMMTSCTYVHNVCGTLCSQNSTTAMLLGIPQHRRKHVLVEW